MSFDLQPTLSDDLVVLRPLRVEDWDALYAVASDPLLWAGHPAHDRWQEPVFRRYFDAGIACGGAFVITDAATGAVIGSSRYGLDRVEPGEIEIGWSFVARDRWGGGYNPAAKRLMIDHALRHFERTIFLVGADNIRSRRAMENIGGVLTDREYVTEMGGVPTVHVIYTIDRAGFENGPWVRTNPS
ncbi:MAG: GNAT family N-acetyltransferase [Sphingobium sp.]